VVELSLDQTKDYALDVIHYSPWLVHVIDRRVFVNGTEYVVEGVDGDLITFVGGSFARCVRWLDSATHHIDWPGYRILDSSFDYWLAKVVQYF
jgi:hypothetical protein